jgi:hypothetical protein
MVLEILDSYLPITSIESQMMQRRIDGEQMLQNMKLTPYIAGKGGRAERISG